MRIDVLLFSLIRVDKKFLRKEICLSLEIRGAFKPSVAQLDFSTQHPSTLTQYTGTESGSGDGFIIQNFSSNSRYTISLNKFVVCNKELCKVKCDKCDTNFCVHSFMCTCRRYAYRCACKHLHVFSVYMQSKVTGIVVSYYDLCLFQLFSGLPSTIFKMFFIERTL